MAWITTTECTTYGWHDVPNAEVPADREMKAALVDRLNENLYTQDAQIRVEVVGMYQEACAVLGVEPRPPAEH